MLQGSILAMILHRGICAYTPQIAVRIESKKKLWSRSMCCYSTHWKIQRHVMLNVLFQHSFTAFRANSKLSQFSTPQDFVIPTCFGHALEREYADQCKRCQLAGKIDTEKPYKTLAMCNVVRSRSRESSRSQHLKTFYHLNRSRLIPARWNLGHQVVP